MLLEREPAGAAEAVARLAGMQAQEPKPPFAGLWSRVEGFDAGDLRAALHSGKVVRAILMRGTLHLIEAAGYGPLRGALQPALEDIPRLLGSRAEGLVVEDVLPVARELLAEQPRTFNETRALLSERFPDVNERALGFVVRMNLPLTMVPTDDRWGFARDSKFALAREEPGDAALLVRRYLGAYGPATVADAQTWSGLKGLKPVFESIRDELDVLEDDRGRELFDLPGAPRPGAEAPAPPRFLPEFDSLVLAYADRTRLITDEQRGEVVTKNLRVRATFLLDGMVAGTWKPERKRKLATLTMTPFDRLPKKAEKALAEEGERLLRFLEPDAETFAVT
jgi:winged helix DNA-binding protein